MMNFSDPFLGNGTKASKPLIALAEDILHYAHIISDYFDEHHLPQPSFELDGPEDYSNDLPDEIHEARAKLRGSAADMGVLAAGPKANLMWMVWNYHDVSTLNYVQHFHIAEAVPLIGSVRVEEVTPHTSLITTLWLTDHGVGCCGHEHTCWTIKANTTLSYAPPCFC